MCFFTMCVYTHTRKYVYVCIYVCDIHVCDIHVCVFIHVYN